MCAINPQLKVTIMNKDAKQERIPCFVCNGTGYVSVKMARFIEQQKAKVMKYVPGGKK